MAVASDPTSFRVRIEKDKAQKGSIAQVAARLCVVPALDWAEKVMEHMGQEAFLALFQRELTRRTLFKGAAATAGAAALASSGLGSGFGLGLAYAQAAPFKTDLDVLNFALTLEQLEATLYNTLVGDPASGLGTGLTATGSAGLIKNATYLKYVSVFRDHENQHVTAVTAAIKGAGGTPVTAKAKYHFPAVTDEAGAMNALAMVEEVGVGAYQGAAGFIKSKSILTTAVSIHGVEAEHTGSLHQLLGLDPAGDSKVSGHPVLNGAFTKPLDYATVIGIVGPILGA